MEIVQSKYGTSLMILSHRHKFVEEIIHLKI